MAHSDPRPRFTAREGRLLLSALFRWRKSGEDWDGELDDLYEHLERHYGDDNGPTRPKGKS